MENKLTNIRNFSKTENIDYSLLLAFLDGSITSQLLTVWIVNILSFVQKILDEGSGFLFLKDVLWEA